MRQEFKEHYKWLFKNPIFWMMVLADIACLVCFVFYGIEDMVPGLNNISALALFAHTAPAFFVIFTGMIVDHLLIGRTAKMLVVLLCAIGALLFFVLALIQLFALPKYDGDITDLIICVIISFLVCVLLATIICVTFFCPIREPRSVEMRASYGIARAGGSPQRRLTPTTADTPLSRRVYEAPSTKDQRRSYERAKKEPRRYGSWEDLPSNRRETPAPFKPVKSPEKIPESPVTVPQESPSRRSPRMSPRKF